LGGVNDVSYLTGHSSTYIASQPGIIVQKLTSVEFKNGIIFFDEFDKLTKTTHGQEVMSAFLHILDEQQNECFQDKFLQGIDIDLSQTWFIVAGNKFDNTKDSNMLISALQDRLHIINLKSYNKTDKISILNNYFIPKLLQEFNVENKIIFSDNIVEYLVSMSHKNDSGVRLIKEHARLIINKIKMYQDLSTDELSIDDLKMGFTIKDYKIPTVITRNIINQIIETKKENNIPMFLYT
jgi:ATP-dependent Lon protease